MTNITTRRRDGGRLKRDETTTTLTRRSLDSSTLLMVVALALATLIVEPTLAFCPPLSSRPIANDATASRRSSGSPAAFQSFDARSNNHHVRKPFRLFLGENNGDDQHEEENTVTSKSSLLNPQNADSSDSQRRREMLQSVLSSAILLITALSSRPLPSQARGLIQFPVSDQRPLLNTYHFLACGTSLLEQDDDIWSTNPLFLTNRESALSPTGQAQVQAACQPLTSLKLIPTVVRYSLAAQCCDASVIVSRELKLGTDRVVPEYTFLDPRSIGAWDMTSRVETAPILYALDNDNAGPAGTGPNSRPPPNSDGTPNETLADQAVRLRQLISLLETQYSGDTVLLIFPDTTGPALLSCMMTGIPYNRCHELEYEPGELRLQITPASTKALWQQRLKDERFVADYNAKLERGRMQLRQLRYYEDYGTKDIDNAGSAMNEGKSTTSSDDISTNKMQQHDGDKDNKAAAPATPGTTLVNKKDAKIEAERLEVERQYAQEPVVQRRKQQEKDEALRKERAALIQQQRLQQRKERQEQGQVSDGDSASQIIGGVAVLGTLAAAQFAFSRDSEEDESSRTGTRTTTIPVIDPSEMTSSTPNGDTDAVISSNNVTEARRGSPAVVATPFGDAPSTTASILDSNGAPLGDSSTTVRSERALVNGDARTSSLYGGDSSTAEADRLDAAEKAMEDYLNQDDGAEDWILSLAEIIEEDEDDDDDDLNNVIDPSSVFDDDNDGVETMAKNKTGTTSK